MFKNNGSKYKPYLINGNRLHLKLDLLKAKDSKRELLTNYMGLILFKCLLLRNDLRIKQLIGLIGWINDFYYFIFITSFLNYSSISNYYQFFRIEAYKTILIYVILLCLFIYNLLNILARKYCTLFDIIEI